MSKIQSNSSFIDDGVSSNSDNLSQVTESIDDGVIHTTDSDV